MELHQGEEIVFDGHPSWRAVLGLYLKGLTAAIALGAVLWFAVDPVAGIVAFLVIDTLLVAIGYVKRAATRYVITTERLHIRRGLLSKATQETRIDRVQNVNTDQSLLERMLRVGTVDFDTAGTDDSEFRFVGVADPAEVVRSVDRAQRAPGTTA